MAACQASYPASCPHTCMHACTQQNRNEHHYVGAATALQEQRLAAPNNYQARGLCSACLPLCPPGAISQPNARVVVLCHPQTHLPAKPDHYSRSQQPAIHDMQSHTSTHKWCTRSVSSVSGREGTYSCSREFAPCERKSREGSASTGMIACRRCAVCVL